MAHLLEINIHPHHYTNNKQSDPGYLSSDDTTSSFTASPTTDKSTSRRSSFSSIESTYDTLSLAHERIDYLEDQIRTRKLSNHSIVKDMSFQIQTFLDNRQSDPPFSFRDTDHVVLGPVLNTLNEIKDLVAKHPMSLSLGVSQNVDKHARLAQALQTLSQQHTSTKRQLKTLQKRHATLFRSHTQLTTAHTLLKQDAQEMESLLDDVRQEMEVMMEELEGVKSDRERHAEKAERLEQDLRAFDTEEDEDDFQNMALRGLLREAETRIEQVELEAEVQRVQHAAETTAFKTKLALAQTSAAEVALKAAVQKRQAQSAEMEQALRRTVAEKDGELAKMGQELVKSQRAMEQLKKQGDQRMQLELNTRLDEMKIQLTSEHKKISDTYQVQISRELRTLSGQLVELQTEVEDLERQHEQDVKRSQKEEDRLKQVQVCLEVHQTKSQEAMDELQDKIGVLESEVLLLYSKNLELAQHLGELDE
ncbi:hypothetical protein INT47_011770 [Mucor saturninus]|uniref:Uncharacterized protein n=1 Tax=Mucor saturninus TaxID=64648 RepID=A0A8H7QK22_9FUNG|nr:hypothetical protein INT47_011770 [Mucor saturninus]